MLFPVNRPTTTKQEKSRFSIRVSSSLIKEMSKYHKPKQKSVWVEEAVLDLLSRSVYKTAIWTDCNDENTEQFLMLVDFSEKMVKSQGEVFLFSTGTIKAIDNAVCNIRNIADSLGIDFIGIKASIVRAAIRQRVVLGGVRSATLF